MPIRTWRFWRLRKDLSARQAARRKDLLVRKAPASRRGLVRLYGCGTRGDGRRGTSEPPA